MVKPTCVPLTLIDQPINRRARLIFTRFLLPNNMNHGARNHKSQSHKEWKVRVRPSCQIANKKDNNTDANHRKADIWIKFPHNQFYVKTKLQKRFG